MEPRIASSMELFDMFNSGQAYLVNPITEPATATVDQSKEMATQVNAQMDLMDPADLSFPILRNLKASLDDCTTQVNALNTHAQTMIFGDSSGSVISGGLSSNLSTAVSALNLNNTMTALGQTSQGTTDPSDPCAMIGDFFNSVMGKGQELIADVQSAINDAIAPVRDLINQINTAIGTGIQALRDTISQITAQINAAISEITNTIAEELANFGKWLNLLFNFNLSSFLSGLFNNSCAQLLIGAVTSPEAQTILSQVSSGTPRANRPFAGRMW